jgi:hypothetical protein
MKITIQQAAVKFVKARDAKKLFQLLDKLAGDLRFNPADLPLICNINRCGQDGHSFAWDVLEDWQNS